MSELVKIEKRGPILEIIRPVGVVDVGVDETREDGCARKIEMPRPPWDREVQGPAGSHDVAVPDNDETTLDRVGARSVDHSAGDDRDRSLGHMPVGNVRPFHIPIGSDANLLQCVAIAG